jgi:hypothetical protein
MDLKTLESDSENEKFNDSRTAIFSEISIDQSDGSVNVIPIQLLKVISKMRNMTIQGLQYSH